MDTLAPAAQAAMADYRLYRISLEREAAEAERSRRTQTAKRARYYAKIVARARLAEEFDQEPSK